MKLMSIAGARPNFMKIASIADAVREYNNAERNSAGKIQHIIVHTGQHYDQKMSQSFFDQLGIPEPDINLGVGSGSHARQTADIMKSFEAVLLKEMPDEVKTMLAERVKEWNWESMARGIRKGIQKGMRKGALNLLTRLLETKFGTMAPGVMDRLELADEQ